MKKMMNQKLLLTIAASCFLAACGEYSKAPVGDIEQLRANARDQYENGPKQLEIPERVEYVPKEVPVPQVVAGYSADDIIIKPKENIFSFFQGVANSYTVKVSSRLPDVEADLEVKDLPDGASFKKVKAGEYSLSWTPSYSSIENGKGYHFYDVTFVAVVTKAKTAQELDILKGFQKELTLRMVVERNTEASEAK